MVIQFQLKAESDEPNPEAKNKASVYISIFPPGGAGGFFYLLSLLEIIFLHFYLYI